jgi:hypothetical protein
MSVSVPTKPMTFPSTRSGVASPMTWIPAVAMQEAVLRAEMRAAAGERLPLLQHPRAVVGVQRPRPAVPERLLHRQVDQFAGPAVEVDAFPARGVAPDAHARGLGQRTETHLAFAQRLFLAPALGDVPGQHREAARRALFVPQMADQRAAPEPRPVLAHAQAVQLATALRRGLREQLPRHAGLTVFRGVEGGHRLAEDLVGGVPGGAGRARVPAGDVAFRIQHVDRVVPHALHQQLEALPFVAQLALDAAAPGEIAQHAEHRRPAVDGHVGRNRLDFDDPAVERPVLDDGRFQHRGRRLQPPHAPSRQLVVLRLDQFEHRASDQLIGLAGAEQAHRGGVDQGQVVAFTDIDGVGRGVDQRAVAFLAIPQRGQCLRLFLVAPRERSRHRIECRRQRADLHRAARQRGARCQVAGREAPRCRDQPRQRVRDQPARGQRQQREQGKGKRRDNDQPLAQPPLGGEVSALLRGADHQIEIAALGSQCRIGIDAVAHALGPDIEYPVAPAVLNRAQQRADREDRVCRRRWIAGEGDHALLRMQDAGGAAWWQFHRSQQLPQPRQVGGDRQHPGEIAGIVLERIAIDQQRPGEDTPDHIIRRRGLPSIPRRLEPAPVGIVPGACNRDGAAEQVPMPVRGGDIDEGRGPWQDLFHQPRARRRIAHPDRIRLCERRGEVARGALERLLLQPGQPEHPRGVLFRRLQRAIALAEVVVHHEKHRGNQHCGQQQQQAPAQALEQASRARGGSRCCDLFRQRPLNARRWAATLRASACSS